MHIDVYQLVAYRDEKNKFERCSLNKIGTVFGDHPDEDTIWHLTNYSCWMLDSSDPIEYYGCTFVPTNYACGYTNDDICFELDGKWKCSLPIGWKTFDDQDSAIRYLFENSHFVGVVLSNRFDYSKIIKNI